MISGAELFILATLLVTFTEKESTSVGRQMYQNNIYQHEMVTNFSTTVSSQNLT